MPRIEHAPITFQRRPGGTVRCQVLHPTPLGPPIPFILEDATIVAVLGAARATALRQALADLFARVDTDCKAVLEASRAAMDSDP